MDKRLDRIEIKLDEVAQRLGSIDSTLAAQQVSLDEHIRRTEILESDIKPVKKHVNMIEGAIKFIGLLAMFAAIIEGIRFFTK